MNISICRSCYCSPNFKNKSYLNADFVRQNPPASDADVVDGVINELKNNGSDIKSNEMLYAVGKIYEKAGVFEIARDFYEKIKSNSQKSMTKDVKDIDFDIKRVKEKESALTGQPGAV